MEVHHHPDLHHRRKRFREYFLEFLMIFLAVTLGFLAENLREHITNQAKEKEYIRAFIRNVQDDTARLRQVIRFDSVQVNGIDRFLRMSHTDFKPDSNRRNFYMLAGGTFYNSFAFISNNATLQQLKSTGDYRLIKRDHVADSLSQYDANIQDITNETNFYNQYFREVLARLDGISDMTVYSDTTFIKKNNTATQKPFPELTADSKELRTLFNKVYDFRMITNSYANNYLKPQLKDATRLIVFLKNTYGIED
jgi:hypothetical protein